VHRRRRRRFLIQQHLLNSGTGSAISAPVRPRRAMRPPVPAAVHACFPQQPPELIRELVAVAHFDLERVRRLVTIRPSLTRSAWDWGFGDWETPLGAASHTGNHEIARFLISRGARPTIFSAAMLGQVEVVRAFVEAAPAIRAHSGPHGISLLAHARAGGGPARAVIDYLESFDDVEDRPDPARPDATDRATILGVYAFGAGERDRFEVLERQGGLAIRRDGHPARPLYRLGVSGFHPAGAAHVHIAFDVDHAGTTRLSIHEGEVVFTARRVPGPGVTDH